MSIAAVLVLAGRAGAQTAVEVSDDGREVVPVTPDKSDGSVIVRELGVPYGTAPDWDNTIRRQVGALQVADMNNDGWADVVVGCYISDSYPPYTDWENMIYYNVGGSLESDPSWISTDEVSTGDIQVGDINSDGFPDVFAANGGYAMDWSVIYWGSASGPSTSPGWYSQEPGRAWNNYARIFDFNHDGYLDVVTANQGNSPTDPTRPMYAFINNNGTLPTTPGWQSAETSIQNYLDFADYDGDNWEDLAVSKWSGYESGVYRNLSGSLATTPGWTTGDTDSDKGVAWLDADGNGWPDLALGHDPTELFTNSWGVLKLTWSAVGTYFGHSELIAYDVDRDGDEDLAEMHFSNGKLQIYLNNDGTLSTTPSWVYDSAGAGTAIAFGDINGDHWPDLVAGYSGQPCVKVFYAQPPAKGDLDRDGDIDGDDYPLLAECLGGPDAPDPGCGAIQFFDADLDGDGDVDLGDFQEFQAIFETP